ncbi:MAG: dipicolinate synthase subunit DpsA [Oscillospiraceae bacterium]
MKFAVIGGDMRSARLAELLAADGHICSAYALDKMFMDGGVTHYAEISEAVLGADCVILPLPVSLKEGFLNAPLSTSSHMLTGVFSALPKDAVICGGRIDEHTAHISDRAGITVVDYFAREELAVANAAAAAEGAVQLLFEELPVTLAGTKCLIIGFGRIGKLLARKLSPLGVDVAVSARRHADFAWIKACGYRVEDTRLLDGRLSDFDVIVNTVPARILGEHRLRQIKSDCLCLDLASKPGGIDFTAAARLQVKAIWALGLPGEVAPVTSGLAIRDTIYNILKERKG